MFRKANQYDRTSIFYLWKETKMRTMGMSASIDAGQVYVYVINSKVVGFVRFRFIDGISMSYLPVNEIYIMEKYVKEFILELDKFILSIGFIQYQVVISFRLLYDILKPFFQYEDKKYKFNSDKTKSNISYILRRNIELSAHNENNFGILSNKGKI